MKIGSEDRKKLLAAGSFGVLALFYLVYTLFSSGGDSSSSPAPVPTPTVRLPATVAASTANVSRSAPARLDPTLHPEGMLLAESLVYSGSGRNIFLPPGAAPAAQAVTIPKPAATARYVPPQPSTAGPAPLPPIDLRFFGTATTRAGKRQAFLLRGDDVFVATTGDVVSRRFRVGAISPTSVEITDLSNNNTQRLPMSSQ